MLRPDRDRCRYRADAGGSVANQDDQFPNAYDTSEATSSAATFDSNGDDSYVNANFFFPSGRVDTINRVRVYAVASGAGVTLDIRSITADATSYSPTTGTSLTTAEIPTSLGWTELTFTARAANETFLVVLGGATGRTVTLYDVLVRAKSGPFGVI